MTPEQRAEWLEWRRAGLGGSDVAAILGLSPWGGEWSVWLSKTQPVEDRDRPELATGRRLERAVLDWMAEDIGADSYEPGEPTIGPEPWMRGTADGDIFVGDIFVGSHATGQLEGIEAKSSRDAPWEQPPIYYEAQCRWYMAVYGLPVWHIGCFFKRHDAWKRWTYERDERIERRMVDTCRAWWTRHIIEGHRPEVDASDACRRWQTEQYNEASDEWGEADERASTIARRYVDLGLTIGQLRNQREHAAAQLREIIGDRAGISGCTIRAKWSRWTTRRIDTARLREDHPGLAAEYETETLAGRLTVRIEED